PCFRLQDVPWHLGGQAIDSTADIMGAALNV
ncbi:unnamed protein product, partial [marine sediment metagenome]